MFNDDETKRTAKKNRRKVKDFGNKLLLKKMSNFTSIPIQRYSPIPNKLTVSRDFYKQSIEDFIPKYGVKFVTSSYKDGTKIERAQEDRMADDSSSVKRRKHVIRYIFKVYYKCHRADEKQEREDQPKGGKSGTTRDLQKKSKKIKCEASLVATCFKSDSNNVILEHSGNHNHQLGAIDDLQYLPLSNAAKVVIEERLREGYRKRDTRIAIQSNFVEYIKANNLGDESSYNTIVHRDQLVHATEIYNIYKKIQEAFYKRSESQEESLKIWLEELKQQGYDTFINNDFDVTFSFGFVSPWQKHLLLSSDSICLDATHSTTKIDKGILYTIVIRHPLTGTGCPVAFFFTKDHSMLPVRDFLYFLRFTVGFNTLKKITIDMSSAELNAINTVYPGVVVQWCLFHVGRAWMSKIRELIKLGSSSLNAQAHKSVITVLKKLMWEKNKPAFINMLRSFIFDYQMYPEFMEYFKKKYLDNDAFTRWSSAFQPQIFTNMETNNYVESWHNQLKTTYLNRKRNRRVDRLVYILVNDVLPDYIQNINRMYLNIGRMSPEERRRRVREMSAENVNEAILATRIFEASDLGDDRQKSGYRVTSFEDENIYYEIVVEQEQMKSCDCDDFSFNRIVCKHMYLVKRLHRRILLFERKFILT